MPGFDRRFLAWTICCLFAGVPMAHAADVNFEDMRAAGDFARALAAASSPVPNVQPDQRPGLHLRAERKFNVLSKKKKSPANSVGLENPMQLNKGDRYPLFIAADRVQGRVDEATEASGQVEARRADAQLFADKLIYRPLEDEVEASSNVRLLQDGAEFETPHLRMKLGEQVGYADDARYRILRDVTNKFYRPHQTVVTVASNNATSTGAPMMLNVPNSYGLPTTAPERRPSEANGAAERIDFEGENQIHLSANTYSTCKPGQTDWYLKSSEMQLDYDENVGRASQATLYFKEVPVFYSPTASFALNSEPRSGFLHPFFSTSTKNGFDISFPYYWAIAPNQDATLYPRYMTKRGLQLGAETQYLDFNYRGVARGEFLPSDQMDNRQRYAYFWQHQQQFGQGFSGWVNWNGVSDDHYWEDMSSRLMSTSQTQLIRQLALNYNPLPGWAASLQMLHYQTLQPDPANPISRPYFLEPQLNVLGYKPNVAGTDLTMIGQFSRFTHPEKVQGERVVLYPQVSLPIITPAFQLTPKVGFHMTRYALNQQTAGEPDGISRAVPTFSLDSTTVFEREDDWFGKPFIQTLEPRLYYLRIPYRDQSRIPVFDSAVSDFNFAQIFGENRYSGYDRINDANQLTAAMTTRILDGGSGVELFKGMLGQRYYFTPQRVTISGEPARKQDFSNIIAAISGLVAPKTYMDLAWEYNYRANTNERLSAGVRFQPELGKVLSASYRYTYDSTTLKPTVDQIDIAGQWPIAPQWYAVGRYNYSVRDKQLLEAIGGFEFNAGCWSLRLVAQRLEAVSTTSTPSTNFFVQLELNDFASIGSNPIGLLRRSIAGYGKTNEMPLSNSNLITP